MGEAWDRAETDATMALRPPCGGMPRAFCGPSHLLQVFQAFIILQISRWARR